ncbi:MAG: sigma-70 family RNA polymerase sigma factor [Pirellulaceae bacterium]
MNELIERAKTGDTQALGQLLAAQSRSLTLLARLEIGRHLQGKLDAADVVQETFMEATKSIGAFEGSSLPQFQAWLRTILAHTLAGTFRRFLGTQARDPRLEQQLVRELDQSAMSLGGILAAPGNTPSEDVSQKEQQARVLEAIANLPEQYEAVLVMRHMENLSFREISERMGRTVDSVEKLWIRGVTRLRKEFTRLTCEGEIH